MIVIKKGAPPGALVTYGLRADTAVVPPGPARYDGPGFDQVKPDIRDALDAEQRGVCCYCTDRIRPSAAGMKIEHRVAQSVDEGRSLDWTNLFGACLGEAPDPSGRGARLTHCDSSKGDRSIEIDPTNPSHVAGLTYERSGRLRSSQPRHQADIDDVLRLNIGPLLDRRREALESLKHELINRRYDLKALPRLRVEKLLARYRDPLTRQRPFVGFLCWWLERAARKAA